MLVRWQTKDEAAAARSRDAESAAWSAVSEEAAAVEPMPVDLSVEDRLADVEMRRKLTRPIEEIVPPEGHSLTTDYCSDIKMSLPRVSQSIQLETTD
jgi:hypothetical protein